MKYNNTARPAAYSAGRSTTWQGKPAKTDPFNPSKITQGLFYAIQFSDMQTESHTDEGNLP